MRAARIKNIAIARSIDRTKVKMKPLIGSAFCRVSEPLPIGRNRDAVQGALGWNGKRKPPGFSRRRLWLTAACQRLDYKA